MSGTLKALTAALALASALCLTARAAQESPRQAVRVRGVVLDEAGAPVAGAEVSLGAGPGVTRRAATGGDGRFVFEDVPAARGTVAARAPGFARAERSWEAPAGGSAEVVFVLAPAALAEQLAVTATRTDTKLGETAASLRVVTSEALAATAAVTIDDALRQVPGFQLFRRTGSRAANPTAQGVSLRGVGASGASRALVLADGVPLGDPFGGWVSWGRVPRASVARIEVLRGGASHLYGSSALGGVVQLLTRRVEDSPALELEASAGGQRTLDATVFASGRAGRWGASLAAETFHTGGYFLVRGVERGAADTPAAARYASLSVTLERELSERLKVFARGSYFGEARANGTRLQRNRTHLRQAVVGADFAGERAGTFTARAYAGTQVFDQSFSAVSADRDTETLTRDQRVPAQTAGLLTQWSRALGTRHAFVAGFEAREVRGASDELVFVAGRAASRVGAGGRERTLGVFAEDTVRLSPKLLLTAGGRFDRWRNTDALSVTTPAGGRGPSAVTVFPDRAESAFSPRASLLYQGAGGLSLYASAYRAFRAPTLNELYRAFRVGNVLTLANEDLRAERLAGAEAGAGFSSAGRRFEARATFFWLEVEGPVANVTLAETPVLITRRRQNLGRTRSRGVEVDVDARLGRRWRLSGGYQLTDSTVLSFPANVALEGRRVPQVPLHALTFRLDYRDPRRLTFGVQGRAGGAQFDDDQNRLRLAPFFNLDALASRRLTDALEAFAAAENLTGRRAEVGRTPLLTLGPPRSLRLGLRLRLGRK
ncbi:MAG TPA: TonB-dependent receptor [Pyrinomonadaceae bacterium]|nr:TonB-dependent receptor [Pyrinomonadaceae bacterium]